VLPFAASICVLSLAQAAIVALPAARPFPVLERLRARGWALIPAASIVVAVVAIGELASVAQGLTYLALIGVPALAAVALGWAWRWASPPLALLVVPLFALAWLDRQGLAGEGAALALSGLSGVMLGVLLAAVAPRRALKAGVVMMALFDAALVVADLLQAPNNVLNAAHPAAGLPQLQRALFGSALVGYGDLFVAGVVGAMLATNPRLQRRGALLAAGLALLFNLLFFVAKELPATVPIALALVLIDAREAGLGRLRRGTLEAAPVK
jgi:hypothetical protein